MTSVYRDRYTEDGDLTSEVYPVGFATRAQAEKCIADLKNNAPTVFGGFYEPGDYLYVVEG